MLPFPEGKKYQIIYADPPWNWETFSAKGAKKSPTSKYGCMTFEEIAALPVQLIAADDSLLFMWVTRPLLPRQLKITEAWGFTYKTIGFTWIKLNPKSGTPFIGLGYYTRANSELCLIGRRGIPPRPARKDVSEIILSPIREHSRKPDEIPGLIRDMYPKGRAIELFARTKRKGWDAWGNQVDKFEETPDNLLNFIGT